MGVCLFAGVLSPVNRQGLHQGRIRTLNYLSVTLHTSHLTSTTIFLQQSYFKHTHTHTHTQNQQSFCITVKIFLRTKFFFHTPNTLNRTYQSLSGSQHFSLDSHFGTVNTKTFLQKFLTSTKSAHSIKMYLTVLHATQTEGSSFSKRKE